MRRRGFTLAEVLITLGIVGIVASLTAPSLVTQTQNKINGSKLAATVSLLESAFHNAISSEGVEYLQQTRMFEYYPACFPDYEVVGCSENNVRGFMGELGRYLVVSNYQYVNPHNIYIDNGTDVWGMSSTGGKGTITPSGWNMAGGAMFPIFLKNGAIVHLKTFTNAVPTTEQIDNAIANGSSLYNDPINIHIDVNGIDAPNIYGRDIFHFYVGQNGVLYPVGGVDVAALDGHAGETWDHQDSYSTCLPESGNVKHNSNHESMWGVACAARVIDNGYKINY